MPVAYPKKKFVKLKRPLKFKNKPTRLDGYYFPSQLEADLYAYLKLLVLAGELADLKSQATVHLTRAKIAWKIDFRAYNLKENRIEYFEAKGKETVDYLIKKKLYKYYGFNVLHIFKRGGRGTVVLSETIFPKDNEHGYRET